MGPLRSEWITFGSAKFCCCFKLIQTQTLAGRGTRVPLSLCWRNTRELGGRVIHLDYLLYLLYLCILLLFRILTALSLLRILRLHRKFQDLYLVTLQRGWMTVTQKLSTSAACSRKVFMSSLSLQYWVGWHWCLSATLAPSHSPCARRHATFLAHPASRRRTLGCCKLLYSSIADERCSR